METRNIGKMSVTELMDEFDRAEEPDTKVFDEMTKRAPFDWFLEKFQEMEKRIDGMQIAIDKLKRHKHADGEVVVPI